METYHGYVRTPADAVKLFEACRLGLLPRVQRRLSEKERQSIRSGSVFVWDEREAGMRRWTDGKSWSASRVSGSFLTYREMEGKRGTGFGSARRSNGRTPESGRLSDEDLDGEPEGYRYKADGLMKQSFSITTSAGQHLHLISYYSRPHPGAPDMPQPSTDPQLRHISPAKGMYPESSIHDASPPALTRTPMHPYNNQPAPIPNGISEHQAYGGYPPWAQPAWMGPWPPSPNWAHGRLTPELGSHGRAQQPVQRPPQLPPPQPITSAPAYQAPIYAKAIGPYEHDRLPPPTMATASRAYPLMAGRAPSLSPQSQQLQLQAAQAAQAAHAAMLDPRLAVSARNPQGPLPAMPLPSKGLTPPRTHSDSPPRATSSEGTNGTINKASLSALLHPTPANSEPSSAHTASSNSANSSPRMMASGPNIPPTGNAMFRAEETRAIRSLDRKFYI
ncbi:Uu.00g140890.m01.CDS01 [Anthostomella pinea]|uniref:Uu.00g140890.m01.CDS01 n=1 Tax=Anthostomella pinea TaxID=933095 RepID=A0AAI8YLA9_9PEZI|nr:Uu.00g140890.m01.CDS01 [Anthostomella pinea]